MLMLAVGDARQALSKPKFLPVRASAVPHIIASGFKKPSSIPVHRGHRTGKGLDKSSMLLRHLTSTCLDDGKWVFEV